MIQLLNIQETDPKKQELEETINTILSCSDGSYIEEIYAKAGSIRNGLFTNWVGLMVELNPEFENKSLYDVIDQLEDTDRDFTLVISVEPNGVERGHGTILWKKET